MAAANLLPCHPNPFNPKTTLSFDLDCAEPVSLSIHDLAGRRARSLMEGRNLEPGHYEFGWDGKDGAGWTVSAGV